MSSSVSKPSREKKPHSVSSFPDSRHSSRWSSTAAMTSSLYSSVTEIWTDSSAGCGCSSGEKPTVIPALPSWVYFVSGIATS